MCVNKAWLAAFVLAAAIVAAEVNTEGLSKETAGRLKRLDKTFETELANIGAAADRELRALDGGYVKALGALDAAEREAGRLESLLTIRKERERFAGEKTLGKAHISKDLPQLAELQRKHVSAAADVALTRAKKTIDLVRKYDRALGKLQMQLTRADAVQDAVAVKGLRDAVLQRPEVTAAQFAVAEAETRAKKTVPDPPTRVSPPAKRPTLMGKRPQLPEALAQDLLLYYSFDDVSKGVVPDLSGNELHGEVVKASTTSHGKVGGGMRFNGEGDYIKIQPGGEKHAHVPIGRGDFSIFVWVRPDKIKAETAFFSQVNPTAAANQLAGLEFGVTEEGRLTYRVINVSGRKESSRISIAEHVRDWTHVGLVVSRREEARFYVNGKKTDMIDISSARVIDMGASVKGGYAAWFDTLGARTKCGIYGPNCYFDGTMDEFMIFTYAPTDAEVLQIYQAKGGTSSR